MTPSEDPDTDKRIYCACMDTIKPRLRIVRSLAGGSLSTGDGRADGELACLQLRKALEQVAFAALAANRRRYAEAHAHFPIEWNAKTILGRLRELHPEFYPIALDPPVHTEPRCWHFPGYPKDVLTEEEFVFLYDRCSQILHEWNPYRIEVRVVFFGRPLEEWADRIERLLRWHRIQLLGRPEHLVVQFAGDDGKARVLTAWPTAG
jgi:hypothetical protein